MHWRVRKQTTPTYLAGQYSRCLLPLAGSLEPVSGLSSEVHIRIQSTSS